MVSTRCWLIPSLCSFLFLVLPPFLPLNFLVCLGLSSLIWCTDQSIFLTSIQMTQWGLLQNHCLFYVWLASSGLLQTQGSLWPRALSDNSLLCSSLATQICSSLNRPSLLLLLSLTSYVVLHSYKAANQILKYWVEFGGYEYSASICLT